jgi:hypothetical protein
MRIPAPTIPRSEDTLLTDWSPQLIDVWHLTEGLIAAGWKVDTEDSDLMQGLSKTWRTEGLKAWLFLNRFVCAPPHDQQAAIESLGFHRFDPAALPERSLYHETYAPGDEDEPWFAGHREQHGWIIDNGDTFDADDPRFDAVRLSDVPDAIRREVEAALTAAIIPAIPRRPGRFP